MEKYDLYTHLSLVCLFAKVLFLLLPPLLPVCFVRLGHSFRESRLVRVGWEEEEARKEEEQEWRGGANKASERNRGKRHT